MIEEIHVSDLGVIADATLSLGPGLTAVTGETGAGKTMVVQALGLLLGQRADAATVRKGAAQASVDGIWNIAERGDVADRVLEAGGSIEPLGDGTAELHLGRSIAAEGRSRARVGGRAAPAGALADLAERLVVVHGQSDQLRLKSSAAQRDALDRFGGEAVQTAKLAYRAVWDERRTVTATLDKLTSDRVIRTDEATLLREQLALIDEVDPEAGEDEALAARAERLTNTEELRQAAATAREALQSELDAPDVQTLAGEAKRSLERSGDEELGAIAAQIADLAYRAADIAGSLSSLLADLDEHGPAELASIEERRAALGALVRAHGSLNAAIDLRARGSARLLELDSDDDRIDELRLRAEALAEQEAKAATTLSEQRRIAAARLGAEVTAELRTLALPDARFEASVTDAPSSAHGRDEVALLLSPHPGAQPQPVAKTASGGELSRVMLALEVVIAKNDPVPTFIFDEVDAGIGGAAATEVGRRLATLAKTSQVITVTHLAQVAAFATNHLRVVKSTDGQVTASSVVALTGAEREAEMARLLSGMTDSDAATAHARELLDAGSQWSATRT